MKRTITAILGLLSGASLFAQTESTGLPYLRLEIKPVEYCMGSVYNGGFMGLQSGVKAETFLMNGRLIVDAQYNHGWIDIEKLSFPNDDMKPFSDLKFGVRFGKYNEGGSTFKRLRCIDRTERDGNTITEYYEDDDVHGDLHIGLTAGMYMSRAFLKSAFTGESGIDGSVSVNATSVYGGIGITKLIDNKATKYQSGNICTWDQYRFYYINVMYAVQHTVGENYYVGGAPSPIAGQTYPAMPGVEDKLRDFRPFGVSMGYEGGRWRKGFVGSYELGMIPSLKGKGFFVKIGASYAIGIGKQK